MRRMLIVFVATTSSLVFVILFEISLFYTYLCTYGSVVKSDDYPAMFEAGNPSVSICEVFTEYQISLFGTKNKTGIVLWLLDLAILIPSLTFFAINKPHDCFVCLGKDPERIYSRF